METIMIDTGTVREIRDGIVVVGCKRSGGCKSCSSTLCAGEETEFEALNPNDFALEPGDTVEIELSPGKTIAATFYVLILPLILFIAAFAMISALAPEIGEAVKTLVGIAGLCAGFAVSYFRGKRPGSVQMPVVSSVDRPVLR